MGRDVVYAVRVQEFIKIGFTGRGTDQRMKEMQTGNPYVLELIGCADGSMEAETAIHRLLKPYNVRGEWFTDHPDVLDVVDKIVNNDRAWINSIQPRYFAWAVRNVRDEMEHMDTPDALTFEEKLAQIDNIE